MNIKERLHRTVLLAAALTAAAACAAWANAPDPVTSLVASSGTVDGSIWLHWVSGSDGQGGTAAADKYQIRYSFSNISTDSDWQAASSIDQPPVNLTPITPAAANLSQSMNITGLEPGVNYVFAIEAVSNGVSSALAVSNMQAATESCQQDPNDGQSVASITSPQTTIKAGKTTSFDVSVAIGGPGVAQGGEIAVRVPDFWPRPSTATANSGVPGYTTVSVVPPGMNLSSIDDGTLIFTNTSGSTIPSGTIELVYLGFTCESAGTRKFVTASQYSSCGVLTPSGVNLSVAASPGNPEFVDFETYDLAVVQGSFAKIGLRVVDSCRNPVISTVAVPVTVSAEYRNASFFILADTFTAVVSANASGVPASQSTSVTVPASSSSTVVYYKVVSTAHKPDNYLHLQHLNIQSSAQTLNWYANVRVVDSGIGQSSVDTGSIPAAVQKSVTFTPDGDGQDDSAFINFTVPEPLQWLVEIVDSSSNVVRHLYGNAVAARVAWDGFTDGAPGVPPQIAPPDVYTARISFGGGAVTDSSLSITLSAAGITGVVRDGDGNPLSDVDVNVFGPSNRYARTTSSGAFTVYGLKSGQYTVQTHKTGYSTIQSVVNITGGLYNLPLVTMLKQSIIKMYVTRPSAGNLPEIYGQVRVNNSDWSKQDSETVHFRRGKTQADAGDTFNAVPTPFTTLTLAPSVQYRIHFDVPNLKVADSTATLTTNETRAVYADLQRSANITGQVSLPAATATGLWVSVEAGPDSNLDGIYDSPDSSTHYYGGVWVGPGDTSGRYQIFGVNNASYTLTATAPGFVPMRRQVVVSNDVDAAADFPAFTTGGVITGTVTVSGDTSALDSQDGVTDGFFSVPVNAFSNATQTGSYQQVRIATAAAGSLANFTLTGLADGTYDVNANLKGYELLPPGRRTVTVSGGTGSLALDFQPFTGGITGAITLPNGQSDYGQVSITVSPFDFNLSATQVTPSSATYTATGLGTGYYSLTAVYATSGLTVTKNVQIVNGKTVRIDLDLSGQTFTISGHLQTSARAPYNDLTYLVQSSTPSKLTDTATGSAAQLPANRIAVERVGNSNNNPGNGNTPTGAAYYDSRQTFFVTYDSSGAFTIPKLTPGSYRLKNNGEIDGNFTNGPEIAEATLVVRVATADATGQVLGVIDGYDVKGTIRVGSAQVPPGRPVMLRLKNAAGTVVSEQAVDISGGSVNFTISRIPDGDYVLSAEDDQYPKSFSAKDVRVTVSGASPDPLFVDLLQPAQIRGKLRLKSSMTLLTSRNYDQYLSNNFSIQAQANPWFSGGSYQANQPFLDADGNFVIAANPGKYDVVFEAFQPLTPAEISQGKKQFVPLRLSGIDVAAGQSLDLGVVDLQEGGVVNGTVKDRAGHPLANIAILGYPSGNHHGDSIVAVTNEAGQFSLQGVDTDKTRFYDLVAAPRSNNGDSRLADFDGPRYGEVRRVQVDTRLNASVDFVLDLALGSIRGRVATPDNGALNVPFDDQGGSEPGAQIIMNKVGNIPQDNPLGDIEMTSNPDGTFDMTGLVPGTYNCWTLASGYGSGILKNIVVGNGEVNVGTITLEAGQKLFGTLLRPDGTPPNKDDLNVIVGVRNGFEEVLVGNLTQDAAGNITGYSISGFQTDKAYSILAFNNDNDITVLADNLVVNGLTRRDFTLTGRAPSVLTSSLRAADGTITVQFDFTKALRNSAIDLDANGIPDDSDPAKIIVKTSGSGTLTYPSDWLSSDRRRAHVTYTPADGEQHFSLRVAVVFDDQDNATGANYATTSDLTYFLGIGKQKEQKFTNANGGTVQLDEDTSEFTAGAGVFGQKADDEVNVLFRVADTASNFTAPGANPRLTGAAMAVEKGLGAAAYPPEMGAAMEHLRAAGVDPFSSFYDIFLPAGVSHFFPTDHQAQLCVAYDPTAQDPYALNIYYFNTASDEFVLQDENKSVDPDNHRVCVSLGHASVFTVLDSSAPVIAGAGYTGELNVINFPNPFNLKPKVVTLQNPGASTDASQTIEGTMIKVSVPPTMSGTADIEIFSVSGERVRTLHAAVVSAAHNYIEWDGRNDAGAKVASGTYIARMTIGGGNEKFFKMAVLK